MSQLAEKQLNDIVEVIYDSTFSGHCGVDKFNSIIKDNELESLFTENQMKLFSDCELSFQDLGEEEEDVDPDEDEDEDMTGVYEIRFSYPWASGSRLSREDSLEEFLKEEITKAVKFIASQK